MPPKCSLRSPSASPRPSDEGPPRRKLIGECSTDKLLGDGVRSDAWPPPRREATLEPESTPVKAESKLPKPAPPPSPTSVGRRNLTTIESGKGFRHGLVEFESTGTRAKYLIVPKECEDNLAVLRAACRAWELSLPSLAVVIDGGQDIPANWWHWQMRRDVWDSEIGVDGEAIFKDSVANIFGGVANACAESNAWVWSWVDFMGGDWGFEGKTEIFGQERRKATLGEKVVHIAAWDQNWCPIWGFEQYDELAVPVAKEGEEPVAVTEVVTVPDMKKHYVEDAICAKSGRKYKRFVKEGLTPGLPHSVTVPQGQVTHLVLHEKGGRLHIGSLLDALKKFVPAPLLVAQGFPINLYGWVQEAQKNPVILLRHTGGATDVLAEAVLRSRQGVRVPVKHTFTPPGREEDSGLLGGDQLKMSYTLSKGARDSQFVILDARNDSTERVVDKLIQCMSVVDDDETRSLGFQQLELVRLRGAWALFLRFKGNAARQRMLADLLEYLIIAVSFCTALLAVAYVVYADTDYADVGGARRLEGSGEEHGESRAVAEALVQGGVDALGEGGGGGGEPPPPRLCSLDDVVCVLKWSVSALPLLSTFLLSCNSRFSPLNKWRQLETAAARVVSEIYMYRTRVGDYAPLAQDKAAQLALLAGEPQTARTHRAGESPAKGAAKSRSHAGAAGGGAGGEGAAEADAGGGGGARNVAKASRRALFAEALEDIQSTLMNGEVASSALAHEDNDDAAFERYRDKHLHGNQSAAAARRKYSRGGRGFGSSAGSLAPSGGASRAEEAAAYAGLPQEDTAYTINRAAAKLARVEGAEPAAPAAGAATGAASGGGAAGVCAAAPPTAQPQRINQLQDLALDEIQDDGFAPITAEDFIEFRLRPALRRYVRLAPRLATAMTLLQTTIFLASAANAVLALAKRLEYVPLLVALTGSVSAIMDYEMLSVRLLGVNNAQAALGNLLVWWQSLSLIDRRTAEAKRYLVESTEDAVHAELAWMRSSRRKPQRGGLSQADGEKEKET